MSRPLRSHRLLNEECGPRRVIFDRLFKRYKNLGPSEEDDFADVVTAIAAGSAISDRYYRPRSGHKDVLLDDYGVLHLHLGGDASDTLLFLMQFADRVVLLETNAHNRFWNDCRQFISMHQLQPVRKPTVERKKPPRLPRK